MNHECWIAVDTVSSIGSVAVAFGEDTTVRFLEATSSDTLLPTLLALLNDQGLSLKDVTHLACHHGPGAFTGLRVGASVMQGLSWGLKRPLWGACGLEAIAEAYRQHHRVGDVFTHSKVWVVQDARLGEVFWAQFEWTGELWRCYQPPQLNAPEHMVRPSSDNWIGLGSGWVSFPHLQEVQAVVLASLDATVVSDAGSVLNVARRWARSGVSGQIGRIELNYLRNRVAKTVAERAAALIS